MRMIAPKLFRSCAVRHLAETSAHHTNGHLLGFYRTKQRVVFVFLQVGELPNGLSKQHSNLRQLGSCHIHVMCIATCSPSFEDLYDAARSVVFTCSRSHLSQGGASYTESNEAENGFDYSSTS